MDCLVRWFGPKAATPIDYVERDWTAEALDPRLLRRPLPHRGPGPASARPSASRCGPIHWAGTETATHWMGYIDGAVESAERAVAEILA